MRSRGYFYCGLTTTFNIIVYVLSGGKYLWLEGRVRRGAFRNWLRDFRCRPQKFAQPTSEEEIVNLIKGATRLRTFGAGHSFNAGVVTADTLVSLDRYCGVIDIDHEKKQVAFKGGTRVRDISRFLSSIGLGIRALPSHDAQSIAGIISTDVHGTGRDCGFVSEQVVKIKLVDGLGNVHECGPDDELFKAAIGGIGAIGIITEVTLQAVDRFNVEQKVEPSTLAFVKENLDRLLSENTHLSLYLFPFTNKCQINTWNPTNKKKSFLGPLREFVDTSIDAMLAAWFGNFMTYSRLLPKISSLSHGMKRGTDLMMESYQAFNRTIYHLHQELEFAVPYESTFEVCAHFMNLYEDMYRQQVLPYTILEVRFTPAGHTRTLVGPGRGRRSTWIDLLSNHSRNCDKLFAAAELLAKEVGVRPHLGKFNEGMRKTDLLKVHQEHFERFLEIANEHDPERKFTNEFTQRLFWED
jgi:hypothetical protein